MTDAASPATRRPVLRFVVTAAITALLLVVLVRSFADVGAFVAAARDARPAWVLASFAASAVCLLLTVVRWRLVLSAMGYALGFGRALAVVLATWPLAVVTPSRANDLLRPVAVRDVVPLAVGAGAAVAEKAVDLLLLLFVAALGAALQGLMVWAGLITLVLGAEVVVLVLLFRRRAWLSRLPLLRRRPEAVASLADALGAMARAPGKLAAVACASLGIRFFTVVITHTLLVAVGAPVTWFETLTLWPAAMLVGVAPLTLGGMGTRDAAFLALLAARGTHVDASSVLVATVGYSAIATWSFAVLGLPWMIREGLASRGR